MPSNQLVIGVPTFGTLYRMANQSQTTPGSKAIGWITNNQPITTISHSKVFFVVVLFFEFFNYLSFSNETKNRSVMFVIKLIGHWYVKKI